MDKFILLQSVILFYLNFTLVYCHFESNSDKIDPQQDTQRLSFYGHSNRFRQHIYANNFKDSTLTAHPLRVGDSLRKNNNQCFLEEKYQNDGGYKKDPPPRVIKNYGRGFAAIPYGGSMSVPRTVGSYKAFRAKINSRVLTPEEFKKQVASMRIKDCMFCPRSELVIAPKGRTNIILPSCQNSTQYLYGPTTGSVINEGVHLVIHRLKHNGLICRYTLEVKVKRCPPIDTKIPYKCSAENAWGSRCRFTCDQGQIDGPISIHCKDNLRWSGPIPQCSDGTTCELPFLKKGAKLACKTSSKTIYPDGTVPEGFKCRMFYSGKIKIIRCQNGQWSLVYQKRTRRKQRSRFDKCACQNGGVCHANSTCVCPPNTEGLQCEFLKCKENSCLNSGKCLTHNGVHFCFCQDTFHGDKCQFKNG